MANQLDNDVQKILKSFEISQWSHKPNFNSISNLPILTREDLRKIKMDNLLYKTKTSGSTGEPVTIQKTYQDYVLYLATNIRELRWRKWDFSKNLAIVKAGAKKEDIVGWGVPLTLEPKQGMTFKIGFEPISVLQKWLEEKNPHYLHCIPSIVAQLDLSKITNLIDVKGTGEKGGTMYSSEECGTIAIQCPDNKEVYHVMENIIVECDEEGAIIVSNLTNPYVRRYKHGDHIELGECNCGRTLQTIKKIHGRVRNMLVLPNGDKKWPAFSNQLSNSSGDMYETFGIKRFKVIQTTLNDIEVQIIAEQLSIEKMDTLIETIQISLKHPFNVKVKYVESFPNYKFEEFVSLVI
jgi:phenylacetate-CoA ligase